MFLLKKCTLGVAAAAVLSCTTAIAQTVPAGYPADYAALIAAAQKEGTVSIFTSTDSAQSQRLQDAFTKKYGIRIAYNDLGTNGAYNRVISEAAARQVTADIVWTSAMGLQMMLLQEGLAASYVSPEAARLPSWANWQDTVYATTIEPIGIIYNTRALSPDQLPDTYAGMIDFLKNNTVLLAGKVATFDPEKSGAGFLHHSNDARERGDFWDLARALGANRVKIYSSNGAMRETIVSSENLIALNVIGSYALDWVKQSPNLGVHFASDYTPAFARLALITKDAPHPNAARLFLDYMLSVEGQNLIAQGGLPSVRADATDGLNVETLNARVGGGLKPIAVDEGVLDYMEPTKRVRFLEDWKTAIGR